MNEFETVVGRILRASTRGYDCGAHSRSISEYHDFGRFVRAPITNSENTHAVGLIYKVEIKDDQLVSELVMGGDLPDSILYDQRNNRLIPVEIKVLNIGYLTYNDYNEIIPIQSLPPRPPMSLSDVCACTQEEVYEFTKKLDFFRIVLQASEVPSDDLIAAAIRCATYIDRDTDDRMLFQVRCGQRLARDLSNDMKRLAHILALINPVEEDEAWR